MTVRLALAVALVLALVLATNGSSLRRLLRRRAPLRLVPRPILDKRRPHEKRRLATLKAKREAQARLDAFHKNGGAA